MRFCNDCMLGLHHSCRGGCGCACPFAKRTALPVTVKASIIAKVSRGRISLRPGDLVEGVVNPNGSLKVMRYVKTQDVVYPRMPFTVDKRAWKEADRAAR